MHKFDCTENMLQTRPIQKKKKKYDSNEKMAKVWEEVLEKRDSQLEQDLQKGQVKALERTLLEQTKYQAFLPEMQIRDNLKVADPFSKSVIHLF